MGKIILSLVTPLLLLLFSCSNDTAKNDIYVAKGDRAVINSSKGIIKYDFGEGSFNPLTVNTNIILAPNEQLKNAGNSAEMNLRGVNTGTYTFNVINYVVIKIDSITFKSISGAVEITEYGNIGGIIKGSFYGEFKNSVNNEIMSVTDSQFNVIRK